jgi:hypothetical protein
MQTHRLHPNYQVNGTPHQHNTKSIGCQRIFVQGVVQVMEVMYTRAYQTSPRMAGHIFALTMARYLCESPHAIGVRKPFLALESHIFLATPTANMCQGLEGEV